MVLLDSLTTPNPTRFLTAFSEKKSLRTSFNCSNSLESFLANGWFANIAS